MPYTLDAPPDAINALPAPAKRIWVAAFNSAYENYEGTPAEKEETAFQVAWAAVNRKYRQDADGMWVEKRAFVAGNRIIVEMNGGLDGDYTSLSYKPVDAGLGVFMNEGSSPDGSREAVALYFEMASGWDVGRAVAWARRWGGSTGQVLKRIGIETDEASPTHPALFARIHKARLAKAIADPALASKRIAFAEVMKPWTVDYQGSITTDEDVENAAYKFMENALVGIMHVEMGDIGTVVENFISREGDPDFDMPGTWVQGIRFNEEAWQKIVKGEMTGLSVGGIGKVEPIVGNMNEVM